jgi:hypothetical protein
MSFQEPRDRTSKQGSPRTIIVARDGTLHRCGTSPDGARQPLGSNRIRLDVQLGFAAWTGESRIMSYLQEVQTEHVSK